MLPVIIPGCRGSDKVDTDKVLEIPVPHPFEGATVIVPEAIPTEAVTELVVPPEVCDHPVGKLHT